MNQQSAPVNLIRVWNVFKKMWIVVLVLAVIGGGAFYLYTKSTSTPVYRAEAIMYATKLEDNQYNSLTGQTSGVSASDLSLRTLLLNDCIYLANSPLVVDDVNKELEKSGFGKIYSGQISAEPVESTRYFKVTVVTTSPEMSNKALSALCTSIQNQVKRIMSVDNIEKISQSQAYGPIVANPRTSGMKGAAAGIVVGMLIIVIIAFSDRTVKNDDEFAALFPDIPVIGTIPEFNLQTERHNIKKSEKHNSGSQQVQSRPLIRKQELDELSNIGFDDNDL